MNHKITDTWSESGKFLAMCECREIFPDTAADAVTHLLNVVAEELAQATDFYKSMALDDDLDANYRQTQFETACDITDRLFNKEEGTTLDEHQEK